jgi:hypothetical protein
LLARTEFLTSEQAVGAQIGPARLPRRGTPPARSLHNIFALFFIISLLTFVALTRALRNEAEN